MAKGELHDLSRAMNGQAMPLCSICWETLGKYGGPVTLPCGEPHCSICQCCMLSAIDVLDSCQPSEVLTYIWEQCTQIVGSLLAAISSNAC